MSESQQNSPDTDNSLKAKKSKPKNSHSTDKNSANKSPFAKDFNSKSGGNNNDNSPSKIIRSMLMWAAMFAGIVIVYMLMHSNQKKEWEIPYTKYQEFLTNNKIASAIIEKSQINRYVFHGTLKEQVAFEDNGRLVQIQNFTTELGFLDSKMDDRLHHQDCY